MGARDQFDSRSIFTTSNYREIVQNYVEKNAKIKGLKTEISESIGCHLSYFCLFLRGKAHLSLDQGMEFCRFAGLSPVETDYFLCLMLYNRATSAALKDKLDRDLRRIARKGNNRSAKKEELSVAS